MNREGESGGGRETILGDSGRVRCELYNGDDEQRDSKTLTLFLSSFCDEDLSFRKVFVSPGEKANEPADQQNHRLIFVSNA